MCHAIKIIESERLLSRFGHMRNKIEAINLEQFIIHIDFNILQNIPL